MANQGKNGIDVILAESLKELSKTRPIEKITIKEITDKAGVIRPTFYNHFQDKYELLEWIVREDLMESAMPLFDNGLLREGITYLFTAMEKERDFYEKAVRLEGQNSFVGMMEDAVQELILQRMNKDKLREKITYSWPEPGESRGLLRPHGMQCCRAVDRGRHAGADSRIGRSLCDYGCRNP